MTVNVPTLLLEILQRRMTHELARAQAALDRGDPPIVLEVMRDAALDAFREFRDEFARYARVYAEVRRDHALHPFYVN